MSLTNPAIKAVDLSLQFSETSVNPTFSMCSGLWVGVAGNLKVRMGNDPTDTSKDVTFAGVSGHLPIRCCWVDMVHATAQGITAFWSD